MGGDIAHWMSNASSLRMRRGAAFNRYPGDGDRLGEDHVDGRPLTVR